MWLSNQNVNKIREINTFSTMRPYHIFSPSFQMIRMVPTPKPDSNFNSDLDPNHSLEQVVHNIDSTFTDFDLSFLPSAGDCCNLDELPDSPSIGK